MNEQPIYVLKQSAARSLIPKVVTLVLLSAIFYLGVLLNITLLELSLDVESLVKIISLSILGFVILLGIIITLIRIKKPYNFYNNRIERSSKSVPYAQIINVEPSQNALDKMFKTYKIKLNDSMTLKHIPLSVPLKDYITKLISYSKQNSF